MRACTSWRPRRPHPTIPIRAGSPKIPRKMKCLRQVADLSYFPGRYQLFKVWYSHSVKSVKTWNVSTKFPERQISGIFGNLMKQSLHEQICSEFCIFDIDTFGTENSWKELSFFRLELFSKRILSELQIRPTSENEISKNHYSGFLHYKVIIGPKNKFFLLDVFKFESMVWIQSGQENVPDYYSDYFFRQITESMRSVHFLNSLITLPKVMMSACQTAVDSMLVED